MFLRLLSPERTGNRFELYVIYELFDLRRIFEGVGECIGRYYGKGMLIMEELAFFQGKRVLVTATLLKERSICRGDEVIT